MRKPGTTQPTVNTPDHEAVKREKALWPKMSFAAFYRLVIAEGLVTLKARREESLRRTMP